jgi:phosphatidylglycerophosphate synthase
VKLLPWDYLWDGFSKENFPDLYNPMWIASLILLGVLIVAYTVRTRQLHRHRLYLEMWEWLLWTGIITFFLLVMGALFMFDFAVEMTVLVVGLGVLVWARFVRYPALFEAYEIQLARQRYLSRAKASKPEATIRTKTAKRRKRR